MKSLAIIPFAVLSSYMFSIEGSSITSAVDKRVGNDSKVEIISNKFSSDGISEPEEELRQTADKQNGDKITVGIIHNVSESILQPTEFYSEIIKSDADSKSSALNNDKRDNQREDLPLLTTSAVQISSQDNTGGDKIVFNKIKNPKIQNRVQSESSRVHSWRLDFNRIPLQHHFHLVPMDDEPIGEGMIKDHNYLVGILVPASLSILGAILIIGTICSLRYIAKKRAHQSRFDNIEPPEPDTPCISSISSDSTDKVFLLLQDDDN